MELTRNFRRRISLLSAAAAALWLNLATAQAQTAPTLGQQPATQIAPPGSTVNFTVAVAGAGPFYYQWQFYPLSPPPTNSETPFIAPNVPGIISTVAGDGSNSYSGDGAAATLAGLSAPNGVAVDAFGNMFIADTGNSRIRKVDTNGIITTFAGNGTNGFSGDSGAATNAMLHKPCNTAVDSSGNVFIVDALNSRIRKVATNGIITTVAGNGSNSFSGDGSLATNAALYYPQGIALDGAGNLFIADTSNSCVRKVGANGIIHTVAGRGTNALVNGIAATNAILSQPHGVAVDRYGNLFIAGYPPATNAAGFVLIVGTNGIVTTLEQEPAYSLFGQTPIDAKLDEAGNLFVSDWLGDIVLKLAINGDLSLIAGSNAFQLSNGWATGHSGSGGDGGFATLAFLNHPGGVAVDASGDLFIADLTNNRIREVAAQGPTLTLPGITTSNAGSYAVVVSSPYGSVTSSVATLFVGEPEVETAIIGSNVALSVNVTNALPLFYQWQYNGTNLPIIITTVAGNGGDGESGDGGWATNAMLYAGGVAVDGVGNFFIADSANNRVRQVNTNGVISTVAGNGTNGYSGDGSVATNASLFNPVSVAVDGLGNLYIADEVNDRVREVTTNGIIITIAGNGTNGFSGDGGPATNASLSDPQGVALDAIGNLYIADAQNNRVREVTTNGDITTIAGDGTNGFSGDGGAATNASLDLPAGVVVDGSGNLFIADSGNKRIRKVGTNGVISTVAGNGDGGYYGDGGPATNAFLESPAGVAVDALGNLYIADSTEHVREVAANGIISTVAGNAGYGFAGDGGAVTDSELKEVYGVAVDVAGNLFIADTGNNRIRKVIVFGPTLTLSDFSLGEAGLYDLVVSNASGSATSQVIELAPALAPLTASLAGQASLLLQFTGTPGSNYVLEMTTNLSAPANWQPLFTNAAGATGSGAFTDTNTAGSPARFYRLTLP